MLFLACISMSMTVSAQSNADWKKLSKLNDPPNKPSVGAARVATQGLTRHQMIQRLAHLRLAEIKGRSTATGTALQILRREIQLIEVALEVR